MTVQVQRNSVLVDWSSHHFTTYFFILATILAIAINIKLLNIKIFFSDLKMAGQQALTATPSSS